MKEFNILSKQVLLAAIKDLSENILEVKEVSSKYLLYWEGQVLLGDFKSGSDERFCKNEYSNLLHRIALQDDSLSKLVKLTSEIESTEILEKISSLLGDINNRNLAGYALQCALTSLEQWKSLSSVLGYDINKSTHDRQVEKVIELLKLTQV